MLNLSRFCVKLGHLCFLVLAFLGPSLKAAAEPNKNLVEYLNLPVHNGVTPMELNSGAVNLFDYILDESELAIFRSRPGRQKIPRYNRLKHFGEWVYLDNKGCVNTRSKVLVRDDDDGRVTYAPDNKCLVVGGKWHVPYSNRYMKVAQEVHIDHLVPLRNAYYAGAWKWSPAKRCHFANYLGYDYHLIAVSGDENMTKGARGPEDYLPPSNRYVCKYIGHWMRVKAIWKLTMTNEEADALREIIKTWRCRSSDYSISTNELEYEQRKTWRIQPVCYEI